MNKPFTVEDYKKIVEIDSNMEQAGISQDGINSTITELLNNHVQDYISKQSGWVKCEDRLPTKEDAFDGLYIWAWSKNRNGPIDIRYDEVIPKYHSHWRRIERPESKKI